jgi:chaperonin GroEL
VRKEVQTAKNEYDREQKTERLARLEGKVGIIYVGAKSESEMAEKKARVDDSIRSAQAALLEGIMSGGGVAGIRCASELRKIQLDNKYEQLGVNIIIKALEAPYLQMRANAGFEDADWIKRIFVKNSKYKSADISLIYDLPLRGGYNFRTDAYEDLVSSGVIDAVKAFRCALQNAASVAATLLTCNCLIVQEDEPINYPQIR